MKTVTRRDWHIEVWEPKGVFGLLTASPHCAGQKGITIDQSSFDRNHFASWSCS